MRNLSAQTLKLGSLALIFKHSFNLDHRKTTCNLFDLCLTVHLQCRQCNKIKTN
jgi:hypothetical protein